MGKYEEDYLAMTEFLRLLDNLEWLTVEEKAGIYKFVEDKLMGRDEPDEG